MRRPRLVLLLAIAGLLGAAAIATAAISSGGATPKPAPLAVALQRGLTAPEVDGVTARIRFTNKLLPSDLLSSQEGGTSPILGSATGRAWISRDGFRLELQGDNGDFIVVGSGRRITVYDGRANTLYRWTLPAERAQAGAARERRAQDEARREGPLTVADVRRGLDRVSRWWDLSGARPTNVAGRPAYSVDVAPRRDPGLLGAVSLAWDAARGVPLRVAVTARGSAKSVFELAATDISYGSISRSLFAAPNAPGARTESLGPAALMGAREKAPRREVTGVAAVSAQVPGLRAPATLAGLKRQEVRLAGGRAALVRYGRGLGGIAVLQGPGRLPRGLDRLPGVSLGPGLTGRSLPTPLGTLVTWRRDGTVYALVAGRPARAAEAAARALG